MDFAKRNWKWLLAGVSGAAIIAYAASADAADLSGACCADLEERIAELEATTARKGTKKVSLSVYGQLSKSLLFWDVEDFDGQVVTENSAAETFVGFGGSAKIADDWKAGFVLEIGAGGYEGISPAIGADTNGLYTRNAALYLEGPVGRVTLGHFHTATDGIAEISTANTAVAARMLSLRPLVGPQVGEVLDLFDGTRADIVRYDTPLMYGFRASAAWSGGAGDVDFWDVALRYAGEAGGFQFAAGVGYREGLTVPSVGVLTDELKVLSGSASVKHVASGLFVSGAVGQLEVDGIDEDLRGYHGQGGIEIKFTSLGATTLFAEYAKAEVSGIDEDFTLWGGGVVQAIDAAALDVFLSVRQIEVDDVDGLVGQAGARIRF